MKNLTSFFFAVFILIFSGFIAQAQEIDKTKIDEVLNSTIKGVVPGIAVGIVKDEKIVYQKYLGYANLQHNVPVDEKSRFNIASVAKQFTALCVLNLILENKLSLEDDIRKYLPAMYPNIKEPIKIKNLLNHTSGIRDYADLLSVQGNPWWRQEGLDNENVIELLEKQRDLNFKPNTEYLYSNSNYTLLTKIIEKISGKSFSDYSKQIFMQFGMTETNFSTNYMEVIPFQALPYSDWGNGIWQQYPMMTNLYGDGFLFTTLKDQLIFEQAIQKAAKTENKLLVLSQQPIPNVFNQAYGFGLEINKFDGYRSVNHAGSTGSYNAQTMRFPDEKLSIVVLSNNGRIWSGTIAERIASIILKPKENIKPDFPSRPDKVQKQSPLNDLTGKYLDNDGNVINVQFKDGKIYRRIGNNNPRELINEDGNLYYLEGNPKIKYSFETDAANAVLTIYNPAAEPAVYKKTDTFQPSETYLNEFVGEYENTELETKFSVKRAPDNVLIFLRNGAKRELKAEFIQKDLLKFSDYTIKIERNYDKKINAFLLTYNRLKNVRFVKLKER